MGHSTPLLIGLAIVLAGCGSAPAAPGPSKPAELDLTPGTSWIYVDDAGREFTTRVEGPAVVDGLPCVKLRGCVVGVAESRWESQDVAYWSTRDGIPLLHGTGEDDRQLNARQPVSLYRRDAERGISWDGRFGARDPKTGVEDAAGCKFISGGVESVGTVLGTFEAYHVLEEWRYKGKVWVRIESWYADGVGIVRQHYFVYDKDTPIRTLRLNLKVFLRVKRG